MRANDEYRLVRALSLVDSQVVVAKRSLIGECYGFLYALSFVWNALHVTNINPI